MTINLEKTKNKLIYCDVIQRSQNSSSKLFKDFVHGYKQNKLFEFLETREQNPKLKTDQIAKSIGTSRTALGRMRADCGVGSFYRYDVPQTKKAKKNHPAADTNTNTNGGGEYKWDECSLSYKSATT